MGEADRITAIQVGLNSIDIAGTARLFADFGFHNAGGHMIWGEPMSIQGLPPSARGLMWWLIGRQSRVQLELFNLTNPPARPLPEDWRACDLGWTRFGIAVPDYDGAKAVLERWDIPLTGEIAEAGQPRRFAFREPFIGCYVEVFEDGDDIPGGRAPRHHNLEPAVVYATSSVSDLEAARAYYRDVLQQDIDDNLAVHGPEHEAFWGLDGARSESFVVTGGGFLLEIVQYLDPVGRPRRDDYTVADQGMLNIAMASHVNETALAAIDRAHEAGLECATTVVFGDTCGTYVLAPEREVEICSMPETMEAVFGYVPGTPFFGQQF